MQALFSFDVSGVEFSMTSKSDGVGGWRASTSGPLWTSHRKLELDYADLPLGPDNKLDLRDPRALETLLHELYHVEQARRGLWYRLKMRWWNLTIKDRPDLPYSPRPHEKEARLWAQAQVANW